MISRCQSSITCQAMLDLHKTDVVNLMPFDMADCPMILLVCTTVMPCSTATACVSSHLQLAMHLR